MNIERSFSTPVSNFFTLNNHKGMMKMKKGIMGILLVTILICGVYTYIYTSKEAKSYSTPLTALENTEADKLYGFEVAQVIDTKFFEDKKKAYVFYYTFSVDRDDYLAVATFDQNEFGWKFVDFIGVGVVKTTNIGNSVGKDITSIGFVSQDVEKASYKNQEVKLIPLTEQKMVAWILHGIEVDTLDRNELQFYDKNGNRIEE